MQTNTNKRSDDWRRGSRAESPAGRRGEEALRSARFRLSLSLPCPIFLCSHTLSLFLPEFDVNMSLPHYGAFFRKTEDISFVLTTFSFPNAFSLLFLPHSPGPAALPLPPPTCPCVACLVAQQCRTILWRAVALPIPRPQT